MQHRWVVLWVIVSVADVQILQVNLHAGAETGVRFTIEIWVEQIGNFGFAGVELDHDCFFRATDCARGTTFVEPGARGGEGSRRRECRLHPLLA